MAQPSTLAVWAVSLLGLLLGGCGGGSGNTGGIGFPPPSESVVISGRVTFDRLPFNSAVGTGLDADAPLVSPARRVVVEAIDETDRSIIVSGSTDEAGDYSLSVPQNRTLFIRVKAQMLRGGAPGWEVAVRNNTNAGALYALDGSAASSGTANSTRNLHAASGWGTTSYTGTRAAAPFAILDSVFDAQALILSAAPSSEFPALDLFWSPSNRNVVGEFCPDSGSISTSFYAGDGMQDECTVPGTMPSGIYILGAFDGGAGDTDEFDRHVIAHEFGHYFEDRLSRSDSIGGSHGPGEQLDLRVAFGEGWGNAFAAMALEDPLYRESHGGVARDFGFDLQADSQVAEGWFSEFSVGEILWDIFDDDNEPGDDVALGFAPIHAVMTGAQVDTDALTSIFSFASALRSENPSHGPAIRALLAGERIFGTDAFGSGETTGGQALPVYLEVQLGVPVTDVCVRADAGIEDGNKLGNSRFLRFENDAARRVTIRADGAATSAAVGQAATDPDLYLFRRGAVAAFGESSELRVEQIAQIPLEAGVYVLEVLDFALSSSNGPRCVTISISGS